MGAPVGYPDERPGVRGRRFPYTVGVGIPRYRPPADGARGRGSPRVTRRDVYLPEVLFEFHRVGKALRVVAIDPITNTEVTMVGDPKCDRETLKRLAARKLVYVLAKRRKGRDGKA